MRPLLLSPIALWAGIASGSVPFACAAVAISVVTGVLNPNLRSWILVAGFFAFGTAWIQFRGTESLLHATLPKEPITITGWVADLPEKKHNGYRIRLSVAESPIDFHGDVLVDLSTPVAPLYGDSVLVTGKFQDPPVFDDFDYRDYLQRKGIVAVAYGATMVHTGKTAGSPAIRAIHLLRARLEDSLVSSIPEPAASLGVGLVVGGQTGLSASDQEHFRRSGMTHLLAVSGYNMSLIAGLVVLVLLPGIGRRPATLVAVLVVVGYAVIAGATPSALRAAAMVSVASIALLLGHERQVLNSLAVAIMPLLLWNPSLVHDVGFQLSVAATTGLVVLAPRLQTRLTMLPESTREGIAASLSAIVATLPITATTFHSVSLVALPANVAAAPFVTVSTILSILTATIGLASPAVGQVTGALAWVTITPIHSIAAFFGSVPNGYVYIGDLPNAAWIALVVLGSAAYTFQRFLLNIVTVHRRWLAPMGVGLVTVTLVGFNWPGSAATTIAYLPAGDASLIRTTGGQTVLVLGDSTDGLNSALAGHLPFWNRAIDLVIIKDWSAGTALGDLIRRNSIGMVAGPADGRPQRLIDLLDSRGVSVVPIESTTVLRIGDATLVVSSIDGVASARLELPTFSAGWDDGRAATVAHVTIPNYVPPSRAVITPDHTTVTGANIYQHDKESTVLVTVLADRAEIAVLRPLRGLW